jgi:large-conductance mechanosensitive channel
MDIKAQSQGFVGGFVAFLKKANAVTVAIGIAVGVAVVELVNGIMTCFIKPLLALLGGKDSYGGSFKIWVFEVGNFIGVLINFVAVMLVLYLLGKMFIKEDPPK